MATVAFVLNGKQVSLDVDFGTPLLWVLRDQLHLTGTKYGCGRGLCGACTVHVNDTATRACITPIERISKKSITTIEGLSENHNHPVQRAWIAENVPQCGYCQSGQIMSAAALLAQDAQPSDNKIDQVMSGNLCRCGTYPRIRRAIHRAAKELSSQPDRVVSRPVVSGK